MTASYTSQHNDLVKRRNITLINMTRSMLKEKNLPHTLYGEAIVTSAYVLNRCPIKKSKEVVHIKKWTGRKQIVRYFKVFGSIFTNIYQMILQGNWMTEVESCCL